MKLTCHLRRLSGTLPIAAWVFVVGCERGETPVPQAPGPKPTPASPATAANATQGDKAMTGHILAEGTLTGTYQR